MSDQVNAPSKTGRAKSAFHVSKARSKVKDFVKIGKQIKENSESDNSAD